MKVSDIIARRSSPQNEAEPRAPDQLISESDRLMKQKLDIEKELAMATHQQTLPDDDFVMPQQQQMYNQQPQPPQPQQRMQMQEQVPTKNNFRMTIYLETGQKLPVVFAAYPEEVVLMLKNIDAEIEAGRVLTIGDFKIPGNRIAYIDLQGR